MTLAGQDGTSCAVDRANSSVAGARRKVGLFLHTLKLEPDFGNHASEHTSVVVVSIPDDAACPAVLCCTKGGLKNDCHYTATCCVTIGASTG